MNKTNKAPVKLPKNVDYYEIAVRQFRQQILPTGLPTTIVWSYGSINHPWTFNYPAFTIEAKYNGPVRVKWINDLIDPLTGNFLPHIVPVDQTLHWANPPAGPNNTDSHGMDPNVYLGPVPIVTHLHGAHVDEESDGYPEAWYLPNAADIPAGYATFGSLYNTNKAIFEGKYGQTWEPGTAVFQYRNDQRATTLWYHDHSLGMTRSNVYAGPAGFYLIRGGPDDLKAGVLPGPAPGPMNSPNQKFPPRIYEIPIVVQDRSFNADGTLFYPDNRAFFEGLTVSQLQIPLHPEIACDGNESDIAPIWNPEFFGNMMVVNGRTWPFLEVEQRRYRFRFLNGCNSRFLILQFDNGLPFWQIGAEGGFLPTPVSLNTLLMGNAERADVIVDFTSVPVGTNIILQNIGPDEPFGGGVPGVDFPVSDPCTTGQVMQFRVVARVDGDKSTPPDQLVLPTRVPLPAHTVTRQLTLNELDSSNVFVPADANGNFIFDANGNLVLDCNSTTPFGPRVAMLGTFTLGPLGWDAPITEDPNLGATELWEIINTTMDAHPIHLHMVQFEVVNRVGGTGLRPPEPWETGLKDTVIAFPGEVTRVKATFDIPGLFVWHCHIVEHEDNEMMRPYRVGP
jgi:FtsP/CotA-like multicopper oxidase with cupredoxin domain